jgi:hypothetical protein
MNKQLALGVIGVISTLLIGLCQLAKIVILLTKNVSSQYLISEISILLYLILIFYLCIKAFDGMD